MAIGLGPVLGSLSESQYRNDEMTDNSQSGVNATVANASWNGSLAPGATLTGVGFNGTFDNATNPIPVSITMNNKRCAIG